MENTPWMDPRFLFPAAVVIVGLIAWFVKLEFKGIANSSRQKEYEEYMDEQAGELKKEHKELKTAFYQHATNTKIHHNEEMFKEFREGINRRFGGLENTLIDINRKLDHIAGREGK